MPMRPIRVSEINTYLYCARAWGYARKGEKSRNQKEMQAGTEFHRRHGRAVTTAFLLRALGWGMVLLALVLAAAWFAWQVSGG